MTSCKSLELSAIVVISEEEKYVKKCLDSLSFCDELIVVNIGIKEHVMEELKKYDIKIIEHEKKPYVEKILKDVIDKTKYKWVLMIDPDEVVRKDLVPLIKKAIKKGKVGKISLPRRYFFKGKMLKGGTWGGWKNKNDAIVHKKRVNASGQIHKGFELKEKYEKLEVSHSNEEAYIEHYWVDSINKMIEKHLRYLEHEGKMRYERGDRFPGWFTWAIYSVGEVFRSLFWLGGWRDGLYGLFLSFFSAWYKSSCLLSLKKYEQKMQ